MIPVWKMTELRQQVAVIDGKQAPTIVLKNAQYLHSMLKQWVEGNIWILGDRIVYAGSEMPPLLEGTEVVEGDKLAPKAGTNHYEKYVELTHKNALALVLKIYKYRGRDVIDIVFI